MIKLWGWEKKPRTMLRYIKIGDIFCFKYDEHIYCFGRIIAEVQFYIVEIFDYTSEQPVISEDTIHNTGCLWVTLLDVYSLFDRRSEGEWMIIGHQDNFTPECTEDIWFSWGIGFDCRKSDIFGNTVHISEDEWRTLPRLSPQGDYVVRRVLSDKLNGKQIR